MGFASLPSIPFCLKMFPSSSSRDVHHPSQTYLKPCHRKLPQKAHASFDFHSPFTNKDLTQRSFSSRNSDSMLVPFCNKSSGPGADDHRALETVLKLYTAIQQRNLRELSDVIGDECRCVCNFISGFHPFLGKKQVLEFFSFLMGSMGPNIEFVVQPTFHDGMNVSVKWKLEWEKSQIPLGKGFSFYLCHIYEGKVVIRNVEIFMEPLLHLEPLRLNIMGFVMSGLDKIGAHSILKGKGRRMMYFLLSLVVFVALLVMLKLSFF